MKKTFDFANVIKHFKVIVRHKNLVMRWCFDVGLYWQGFSHDLSKFTVSEFVAGAYYFRSPNYSPCTSEKRELGFSKSWLHHKGRNKHHPEYWIDFSNNEKKYVLINMPLKFVVEMAIDRICAAKTYMGVNYNDKAPLDYLLNGNDKEKMYYENYIELKKILISLSENGEKKTKRYIKNLLRLEKAKRKRKNK